MSKYHLSIDFTKFEVYTTLTDFIRSIQALLNYNYYYYVTGTLSVHKLPGFIEKLEPLYQLSETSVDKNRRFELDQPTVVIRMFQPNPGEIIYIIMARYGNNGSKKHIFFEREKYKDATNKNQRISVWHYEFLRINKAAFEYTKTDNKTGEQITVKTSGAQGVWTLQLTEEYKSSIKDSFKQVLLKRNLPGIKTKATQITKLIGWHKVRADYKNLKKYLETAVVKMRLSDPKYPVKQLSDVIKLHSELKYFRPMKAVIKITVAQVIEDAKVKIINVGEKIKTDKPSPAAPKETKIITPQKEQNP